MYRGGAKVSGGGLRCQFFIYNHHHAEGVALGQSSPFKGKTDTPNDPPTSPCLHHCTSTRNDTRPRSKHESPVIRKNHVRRLQRR